MDFLFALVIITSSGTTANFHAYGVNHSQTSYTFTKIETFETKSLCEREGNRMLNKILALDNQGLKNARSAMLGFECLERGKPQK